MTYHPSLFPPLGGAFLVPLVALEAWQVSGHLVAVGTAHGNATLPFHSTDI